MMVKIMLNGGKGGDTRHVPELQLASCSSNVVEGIPEDQFQYSL